MNNQCSSVALPPVIRRFFNVAMACVLAYGVGGWLTGCAESPQVPDVASGESDSVVRVKTGAQVLSEGGFKILSGKRVGLVTNPTAQIDGVHLIDLLHAAPDVELVALFGPEHGLRGNAEAGAAVDDGLDDATGVPVYSLYGTTNAPAPEILATLD